jgi:all-trans-8'-apo-beta-carotenal 15,15'-oxygenase
MPYCLDPHTLETLGPDDLCGALKLKALAAHFRIDAENQVWKEPKYSYYYQNVSS